MHFTLTLTLKPPLSPTMWSSQKSRTHMSCRVALLRMHRAGLIQLPPPQQACYNGRLRRRRTPQAEPQLPITGSVQGLSELHLRPVAKGAEAALWREYVDRYHWELHTKVTIGAKPPSLPALPAPPPTFRRPENRTRKL